MSGSREVDISSLTDRVMVQAVEYPLDKYPPRYQRFSIWGDVLMILSGNEPDGANACIYYGKLHSMDESGSTVSGKHEEVLASGACGYAALSLAAASINRVNIGGKMSCVPGAKPG